MIFDIVRGSTVDGPGLRTVVFLKGCPLRCVWCQNPEGQTTEKEISFDPDSCIACGRCQEACPNNSITLDRYDRIERQTCRRCGVCAEACDTLAITEVGACYTPDELVRLLLDDRIYFDTSSGGVTFSGGEPLSHMAFLAPVVKTLKDNGIHIAIETCGYFDYSLFEKTILPWTDLVMFDIKIIDTEFHEAHTGISNHLILRNFEHLFKDHPDIVQPRIPLIPGITATKRNLIDIAAFFKARGVEDYTLLTYNPSGIGKHHRLGHSSPASIRETPLSLKEEQDIRVFLSRKMEQD